MRRQVRDQISFYRFESLSDGGRIEHAIFTRQGGSSRAPYDTLNLSLSVPDRESVVFANRAKAYGTHGRSNDSLVHAHLVHGSDAALVTSSDYGAYVGPVDALLTNEPGCGLTMNFADCAPVILYDPANKAIGLGHSGWQGAVKDLPGSMVRAMQHAYGSDPAGLVAGIGPCIGPCCYEVGEPVISAVQEGFARGETLLVATPTDRRTEESNNRPHFDLPEANRRRLEAAGVRHIEPSGLCTACRTDLFYSHRAENGQTGRFGAILILN